MSDNECGANIKRRRSANFTLTDKDRLFNIVYKYKNVVENKATDAVTWREKEAAWVDIKNEFNMHSLTPRSKDALKKCYQNAKKNVRKEVANEKMEINKTGGGVPKLIVRDPQQHILLNIVNMKTVKGLNNPYGMDGNNNDVANDEPEDEPIDTIESIIEAGEVDTESQPQSNNETLNWGDYKASHLKTPVNSKLKNKERKKMGSPWVERRRPVLKQLATSHISEEYMELAKIKKKNAMIQQDLLKVDLDFKTKHNEAILKNLELEADIKRLQLKMFEDQHREANYKL